MKTNISETILLTLRTLLLGIAVIGICANPSSESAWWYQFLGSKIVGVSAVLALIAMESFVKLLTEHTDTQSPKP